MNRLFLFWIFVITSLMFLSCKEAVKLDKTKLNSTYFVGEYKTNYLGITEKVTLKANGFYDYIHDNDTVIVDAGKWIFENGKFCYVSLSTFPNIRSKKIFTDEGDRVNLSFDVNTHLEKNLGDLEKLVIDDRGGELYYTFVKMDKSRNKDYLLKTEK
jgi:hypothetical protein